MFGEEGAKSPHVAFPGYYKGGELQTIRDRQYKLVFPHKYRSLNGREGNDTGKPIKYDSNTAELALYDLSEDIGETKNVADEHPEVMQRLMNYAQQYREDLGDKLTKTKGSGVRPAGTVK